MDEYFVQLKDEPDALSGSNEMRDQLNLPYPLPENELERLECLHGLDILDTPPDPCFDSIVDMARRIFDVPVVLVSLIDKDRQWFKARIGVDAAETPRRDALCNYTISQGQTFVVADASGDARFSNNPLVVGEPGIRFYAGSPLYMQDGLIAGSLCIIDRQPRDLGEDGVELLERLASTVAALLSQRRMVRDIDKMSVQLAEQSRLLDDQTHRLFVKKHLLESASAMAKLGAWEFDVQQSTLVWSDAMYDMHELDRTFQVAPSAMRHFYSEEDFEILTKSFKEARVTGQPFTYDAELITAKGNHRFVHGSAQVEIVNGVALRVFGMQQDITAQKRSEDRLKHLSERDGLTNLYNRVSLLSHLDCAAKRKLGVAVLMLDLDGFKAINDSYGHAAGDACLKAIARRLFVLRSAGQFIARLGGDEFAVVDTGSQEVSRILELAVRVKDIAAQPIAWKGHTFQLSTSIGISFRNAGETFTKADLMSEADLALYKSKNDGRNCFSLFTPQLKQRSDERVAEINAIRGALAKNELELYYQARVPLAARKTGGFEALLRWNHPDGTVLAPGMFLAALEDPQLSIKIGDFVLRTALNQAVAWRRRGLDFGSIAINIGAGQFRNPDLAHRILAELHIRNLEPSMFEIEITEDVMLSGATDSVLATCKILRDNGVGVSFDDFGTGFASLTHLLEFPLSALKIDRSFISRLSTHAGTTSIVRATCEIGHGLGLEVIAEGVETQPQADFLKSIGCDFAQGYLFHRPSAVGDAEQFCQRLERSA